jgi:hypothetical protein
MDHLVADEECFTCGVDDLGCQRVERVEGLDAFDLGDESVDEADVAARDADDGRDGGRVSDPAVSRAVGGRESLGEDGAEFVRGEWFVFVGEADAAVSCG